MQTPEHLGTLVEKNYALTPIEFIDSLLPWLPDRYREQKTHKAKENENDRRKSGQRSHGLPDPMEIAQTVVELCSGSNRQVRLADAVAQAIRDDRKARGI